MLQFRKKGFDWDKEGSRFHRCFLRKIKFDCCKINSELLELNGLFDIQIFGLKEGNICNTYQIL